MKVYVARGEYWENGLVIIAANSEEEAETVARTADSWAPDYSILDTLEGVVAEGPPRVLWR